MFKRFLLWASAAVFLCSIFLLLTVGVASRIVRPDHVKSWLTSSGSYQKMPDAVIAQAAKDQATTGDLSDSLSLANKQVRNSAQQVLNSSFFQKSIESVIDGTFVWLDGRAPKPTFSIDVLAAKQQFADNLGTFLKERYNALPVCAAGTVPNSSDLQKINCRPSEGVFDIDQAISNQKLQLLQDSSFLANQKIEPNSVSNIFDKSFIPTSYQAIYWSPVIFGAIALLSACLVVLLCERKKFGIRKLGWRLLVAGLVAAALAGLAVYSLAEVQHLVTHQPADSAVTPYGQILSNIIAAGRTDYLKFSLAAAGFSSFIGLFVLVLTKSESRKSRRQGKPDVSKLPPQAPQSSEPAKQIETPVAVAVAKPKPKRTLIQ